MSEEPSDRITTGDANLDLVLGGGLVRGSATLITGPPGAGKSILSQQVAFANATPDHSVLHVSTFTEPQAKIVRNLSGFDFFDAERFGSEIVPLGLSDVLMEGDRLQSFTEEVLNEILRLEPAITIIDSVRAAVQLGVVEGLRDALYRLVAQVAHTGTTLLLVGEYPDSISDRPEYAVSDTILWLESGPQGAGDKRAVRVVKHRGSDHLDGRHALEISSRGVTVYPRVESITDVAEVRDTSGRASIGVDGLDEQLSGGLPRGDATLLMGASGTGKTVMATHFVAAGIAEGESALYVTLEESADALRAKWDAFDLPLAAAVDEGRLEVMQAPITELDIDWFAQAVRDAMERLQPSRIVFDSLSELRTGAVREERHPGYLWALANMARRDGASVVFTQEVPTVGALTSQNGVSNLFSNVLLLRYFEDSGVLGRALTILKMRDSMHSHELIRLTIDQDGIHQHGVVEGAKSGLLGWTALRTE